jgi:hypothetical protein
LFGYVEIVCFITTGSPCQTLSPCLRPHSARTIAHNSHFEAATGSDGLLGLADDVVLNEDGLPIESDVLHGNKTQPEVLNYEQTGESVDTRNSSCLDDVDGPA